jgi:hypothetical protein
MTRLRSLRFGVPLALATTLLVGGLAVAASTRSQIPSHDRDWIVMQSRLPAVNREGDLVTISDVRNFRWRSADDFDAAWDTRTYDLARLERIWFGLSPFVQRWRGPAHAFLSFEFADSQFVTVSVEARREKDEEYGVIAGLLNRFELIHVIGDERDLIGLRTHVWGDPVHLYPVAASAQQVREVFLALLEVAESIRVRPRFYNTFSDNCTSALLRAANRARERPLPFGVDVVLPGYADRRLHRLGLLDSDLPLDSARAVYLINERAIQRDLEDPRFSTLIRAAAPATIQGP